MSGTLSSASSSPAMQAASSALQGGGGVPSAGQLQTRAQIHKASQQFEAIIMRQMLAAARKTDLSGGMLQNEGTNTFREMQDSRFADIVSQKGTLGFGKMIEAQLLRQMHLSTPDAPASSAGSTPATTVNGG